MPRKDRQKRYYRDNRIKIRAWQNEHAKNVRKSLRAAIFELLGARCSRCRFDDIRALQVDHVNGGGVKEVRSGGSSIGYYKGILKKIIAGSKEYQILCANCNWIKKSENNEQPYATL